MARPAPIHAGHEGNDVIDAVLPLAIAVTISPIPIIAEILSGGLRAAVRPY